MKNFKILFGAIFLLLIHCNLFAQSSPREANLDFDGFLNLAQEVQEVRQNQLVDFETFLEMMKDPTVVLLDTRSKKAYDQVHIEGAIHLDFSDFTAYKLAQVIPSKDTKILIYCNNNFSSPLGENNTLKQNNGPLQSKGVSAPSSIIPNSSPLALNIPTFITLYGYEYKNVYELSSQVNVNDRNLKLVGTAIKTWDRALSSPISKD